MSFWDSIDSLDLIKTWLIIIGILTALVWGLLMVYWESIKVKSLKRRIIIAIITSAIFGALLLFIDSRTGTLENEKTVKWEKELEESHQKTSDFKAKAESLEYKLEMVELDFTDKISKSESLIIATEEELKSKLQSTSEDLKETQEKMEDRTISDEQKKEFIEFFDNNTKLEIDLYVIPNDEESFQFLKKIIELLTTTGFKCEFKGFLMDPPAFNGVVVYTPTNNFPPFVEMQKALNSIGIRNTGYIKENQSYSHMKIVITKKP